MSDEQWFNFAERVVNAGGELEIYVECREGHIGTSSRSIEPVNNEMNNDNEEDVFARFDMARANNALVPEISDDENEIYEEPEMESEYEEDEYEYGHEESETGSEDEGNDYGYGDEKIVNRETQFVYTEGAGMTSVGTFGDAPADEFEDSSMWEMARTDILLGMEVARDDEILYKGRTFETKLEVKSAVKAWAVKYHREFKVTNSNRNRYIVECKYAKKKY